MADAGAVSRDETLRKGDADEQNKTMDCRCITDCRKQSVKAATAWAAQR